MIVTHTFQLTCRCPENGRLDSYVITVEVQDRVLLVEDIETAAAEYLGREIYQEDLATALSRSLGASATVTITGRHGIFETVATAP
jgi:hypothetical protein